MKKKKSTLDEEPTWDQIGRAIGMKMEKKYKGGECMPWKMKMKEHVHGHGCGGGMLGARRRVFRGQDTRVG